MEKNFIVVGNLNLVNDQMVIVTDPSYSVAQHLNMTTKVKAGRYDALIEFKETEFGDTVSRLAIIRENYDDAYLNPDNAIISCSVGVDSGTIGIFSHKYYDEIHSDKNVEKEWFDENVKDWVGILKYHLCNDFGIISNAGYGNGLYFVYVYENKSGETIGIEVVFDVKANNEE